MTTFVYPEVDNALLRALPPILGAVVRALGFGRAKVFLSEHGGVRVYIPKKFTASLGLSLDELDRLREQLDPYTDASGCVHLPMPDKLFQLVRDAQIRQDKYRVSINTQARQYHLSSRQIKNIRRTAEDAQASLF